MCNQQELRRLGNSDTPQFIGYFLRTCLYFNNHTRSIFPCSASFISELFGDKNCTILFSWWHLSLCIFFSIRTDRQWRDLAFCLSMLSYNERGIRKLQENFSCFHDKLAEEDVYHSFLNIVGKSKKFAKPEVKVRKASVQSLTPALL